MDTVLNMKQLSDVLLWCLLVQCYQYQLTYSYIQQYYAKLSFSSYMFHIENNFKLQ